MKALAPATGFAGTVAGSVAGAGVGINVGTPAGLIAKSSDRSTLGLLVLLAKAFPMTFWAMTSSPRVSSSSGSKFLNSCLSTL